MRKIFSEEKDDFYSKARNTLNFCLAAEDIWISVGYFLSFYILLGPLAAF